MKITIRRNTVGYSMNARILVNGKDVAQIGNGKTVTVNVDEETAVVQTKGTFVGSNRLRLKGDSEQAFIVEMKVHPIAQVLNVAFLASVVLALIMRTKPFELTAGVVVMVYWLFGFICNYRLKVVQK